MREAEFREWLSRRAYQGTRLTAKGVNNRVRKAPRIERALKELGFSDPDLDSVHANGRWPELVKAVSNVATDWKSNEAAARKMAPQAPNPTRQLSNLINVARQYGHFMGGKDPNYDVEADEPEGEEIDEAALETLKARFLARFADFESGGGFPGQSSYGRRESYKRAAVARVGQILDGAAGKSDVLLGGEILDFLTGPTGQGLAFPELSRKIAAIRRRDVGKLEAATGALVRDDGHVVDAAHRFVSVVWDLIVRDTEDNRPFREARALPTLLQALVAPGRAIAINDYQRYSNLGHALLGHKLFGNDLMKPREYAATLTLAADLFTAMEEWGWGPRDLWDVQGFIWDTCDEKPGGSASEMDTMKQSDRIRQYALEHYIHPARERGDASVVIRVGDLHNALELKQAHPNVCSSLRGQKFLVMAGVPAPTYSGPDTSSSTVLTFNLSGLKGAPAQRPTNLILYGPPGTGKTYRTAGEAVRLCDGLNRDDPLLNDPERRADLMARYRQLAADDRIDFVTFHQSIGYEDFVEGLRPTTLTEEGVELTSGFRLQPVPGVFRKIAERAEALSIDESAAGYPLAGRKFFKMSLGEAGNPADDYLFEEAIEGGFLHMGDESGIDWSEPRFDSKMAMIDAYAETHPDEPVLSSLAGAIEFPFTLRHRVRNGDIIIVSKGNLAFRAIGEVTGDYHNVERDDPYTIRRSVHWLWVDREGVSYDVINNKRFSQRTVYELAPAELKLDAIQSLLDSRLNEGSGAAARRRRNFVLVIDEINRANVSKVFGELITLIEPDKRIGEANELRVLLSHSKKPFGVPANLHIVGTMNTADRSIALLDTALRRRFVFREIAPEPELLPVDVDGVPLRRLLKELNERIEYLVDRDHRTGHAFFMGDGGKDRAAIDATMREKVIPLLQEYFFEDWSRVAAVLGGSDGKSGGFLQSVSLKDPTGEGEDRPSWSVRQNFTEDAYLQLIGAVPVLDATPESA